MRLARCDICQTQLYQRAWIIPVRGARWMHDVLCRDCFRWYVKMRKLDKETK